MLTVTCSTDGTELTAYRSDSTRVGVMLTLEGGSLAVWLTPADALMLARYIRKTAKEIKNDR